MTLRHAIEQIARDSDYCPQDGNDEPLSLRFKDVNHNPGESLELFGHDELVTKLAKDYENADAIYRKCLNSYGVNSEMTQVAADVCLAAKTALESRLRELSGNCEIKAASLQDEYALDKDREERKKVCAQTTLAQRIREQMKQRQHDKEQELIFWMWILVLWWFNKLHSRTGAGASFTRSQTSSAFGAASSPL